MVMSPDDDSRASNVANTLAFAIPRMPNPVRNAENAMDQPVGQPSPLKVIALPPRTKRKPPPVPAVVVDRSALFRAGLMHILAGGRFRVTAECATLHELPEQALGTTHCVILIGLDTDVEVCLTRITSLKEKHKGLRVIVLSERLLPEQMLAAIAAGADGYLLKNEISPDAVLKSLELVLVEGVVVPQGITRLLASHGVTPPPVKLESEIVVPPQPDTLSPPNAENCPARTSHETTSNSFLGRLSDREQLILMHLTKGASNKHIARELNIAEATVKVHVKSLLRKIRVSNRTQAAMWAIKHVSLT